MAAEALRLRDWPAPVESETGRAALIIAARERLRQLQQAIEIVELPDGDQVQVEEDSGLLAGAVT